MRQRLRGEVRWIIAAVVIWFAYSYLWRPKPLPFPTVRPVRTYAEAIARTRDLQNLDGPEIKSLCRTLFFDHGKPTPAAIVLLHGYSSSPHKYHILARQLFERGHNVLVPRYPYHGHVSRTYPDFWRMPLEDVIRTANEAVDIAQGLGERVVVLGLSFGGALAAWLAQQRADIDRAVIVSPALGFRSVTGWQRRPVSALARLMPARHTWWDAERRETGGPYHAYASWNTRGAAEMMRLGIHLQALARRHPPRAQSVTVVLNPADRLLDLGRIHDLANAWQHQGAAVDLYVFPEAWGLRHDLIEPDAENAQLERVYPVLIELAERC